MKTYQEALKDLEFWTWVSFCINNDEFIGQYERLKGPVRHKRKIQRKVFDDFTKFCYELYSRLPEQQ